MYRQLYQFGGSPTGIQSLAMDYGRPLEVPQQQPLFTQTGNSTSSPVLNYGQTGLGQAGGTPLTRSGYQEGGLSDFYKAEEPIIPRIENIGGLLDQAEKSVGQPTNNFTSPLANTFSRFGMQEGGMGIMGAMPQDAGMMQEGGQEQTALLTIIQLLIEQGVPPEKAQELAMQILQVFAQGGQPAVEEFANQLEQEEGMPENRTMMAGGGITGLYPRQGYFFKGVVKAVSGAVKGVANAVKSVAKSPIGQIALAIAAPYAIGALVPGFAALGGTGFMGAALRAGISNLAIQGITTGKFNPKQALIAAIGGGVAQGVFGPAGGASTDIGQGTLNAGGAGIPGADIAGSSTLTSGVTSSLPTSSFAELTGQVAPNSMVYNPPTNAASIYTDLAGQVDPTSSVVNVGTPQPNFLDKTTANIKDFGTNLMNDPMGTIKTGIGSIYDTATQTIKDNPYTAVGTSFLAGTQFRAPLAGEDPNEYNKLKAEHDAKVNQYYNQYTGLMYPATFAANGGRIGFEYGSMPMGEPRKNPAGIMELDYRSKGGFVPPVGIKEKADDIPAMLSNNEFVFTANAVRNAGGGDVDRGAQRMYSLMKNLENGGRV
jgi:hypothetical protein